MLEVVRVPVLRDNYAWLLHDDVSGRTAALDPGEAQPLLDAAAARGWTIDAVWLTHWHGDHIDGAAAIKAATGARVIGPEAERAKIPALDDGAGEGDVASLGAARAAVWHVPGHTAGHIAFHFANDQIVFTGDTLFALGCGRLFEGTAAEMFANMQRYAALDDATRVCCGHEYTQSNGRFAMSVDPGNAALAARMVEVDRLRGAGEPTVPTSIGLERATNPFFRATDVATFAALRVQKDNY